MYNIYNISNRVNFQSKNLILKTAWYFYLSDVIIDVVFCNVVWKSNCCSLTVFV